MSNGRHISIVARSIVISPSPNCTNSPNLQLGGKAVGFIRIVRTQKGGHRQETVEKPCLGFVTQLPSVLVYVNECSHTNRQCMVTSAFCSLITVRSRSESRGGVNLVRECTERLLSQRVSLWLLCSHLAKRSKLSGREHFRVPSNFSERTRCENALNLPDASSGVVVSISAFPPRGCLAYLISSYYWSWFTLKEADRRLCCATLPSAGTRGDLHAWPFVSSPLCSV